MLSIWAGRATDEIFSWIDNDTQETLVLNMTALRLALENPEARYQEHFFLAEVEIDQVDYDFVLAKRGIEEPRVARLKEPFLSAPGIILVWANGSGSVTADGNHRLIRRFRDGKRNMEFFFVNQPLWEEFRMAVPFDIARAMALP